MTSNIRYTLLISFLCACVMDIYIQNGNEIVPTSMSATAKDSNSKLVLVRSRLLTWNAPIISELANTINTESIPRQTISTISHHSVRPLGTCLHASRWLELFVRFQDVVLSVIVGFFAWKNKLITFDLIFDLTPTLKTKTEKYEPEHNFCLYTVYICTFCDVLMSMFINLSHWRRH